MAVMGTVYTWRIISVVTAFTPSAELYVLVGKCWSNAFQLTASPTENDLIILRHSTRHPLRLSWSRYFSSDGKLNSQEKDVMPLTGNFCAPACKAMNTIKKAIIFLR